MIKTQVQIPDELYRKAKQIAKEREWSLAEVMRRGLEHMARAYPSASISQTNLPVLNEDSFVDDFDQLDLRDLAAGDESLRSIR